MDASRLLQLLEATARLPTAPFHEGEVMAHVEAWAEASGMVTTRDSFGNVRVESSPGAAPAVVFAAHMDHPGFEIAATDGALVEAKWMGGVEPDYFPGAKVRVFSQPPTTGVCVRTELHPERRRVDTMFLDLEGEVRVGDAGSWNVPEWHLEGAMVHTHAADGLAGCAAVLAALTTLATDGVPALGLFTRAEEVGFVGALGALAEEALPAEAPVLSVEASKAVGAVRQGVGPVLRVGDKQGVFNAGLCRLLLDVASSIHARHSDFQWQRALMDGGTSEATPYSLHGLRSAGITLPLGNDHNRSEDGRALRAETVHLGDFFGAVVLMVETARRLADTEGDAAGRALSDQRDAMQARAQAGLERLRGDGLAGDDADDPVA